MRIRNLDCEILIRRLIYEGESKQRNGGWAIPTSLCNKVQLGRLAKSQLWRGDKGKVICLFCCHSTEADTPSPYPFLFQKKIIAILTYRDLFEFWKLFCLTRLAGPKYCFSLSLFENRFCSDLNVGCWEIFLWFIWFHRWIKLMWP